MIQVPFSQRVSLFEGLEYNLDLLLEVQTNINRTLVGVDAVRGQAGMEKIGIPPSGFTIADILRYTQMKIGQLRVFGKDLLPQSIASLAYEQPDLTVLELQQAGVL